MFAGPLFEVWIDVAIDVAPVERLRLDANEDAAYDDAANEDAAEELVVLLNGLCDGAVM